MTSIVKFVTDKTSLPEDTVKTVIEAILSYFRSKLPKPVLELVEKAVDAND